MSESNKRTLTKELEETDTSKIAKIQPHGAHPIAYRLDGFSINEEGEVFKVPWIKDKLKLEEDIYGKIVLTAKEAKKVVVAYSRLKTGLNSVVPMTCTGPRCIFKETCPLQEIDKAPFGKPCIVERDLIDLYTAMFAKEYEIDLESPTEIFMVSELAELIVYEMRATRLLAKAENASLLQDNIVAFAGDGSPITSKQIHQAWELKERCKNRRSKILTELVGTRREQYKRAVALNKRDSTDLSVSQSEQKREIDRLRKLRAINEAAIDADFVEVTDKNAE